MKKNLDMNGPIILVRGAGEQASGVGWTLAKAGFRVVMTEVAEPLMVRWPVCFGTAVAEGRYQVDGIWACHVEYPQECEATWQRGEIPVIVDPNLEGLQDLNPSILVDAILAKRNLGTKRDMAPLTIGLGPGFTAESDVDVVVETNRGHYLGQLIYSGMSQVNTGVPGAIEGFTKERVVYSSKTGVFTAQKEIGEQVMAGDCLGEVDDGIGSEKVFSSIKGVLRGLLRTNTPVGAFVKIGDIDPRGREEYCWTISEKARAIGSAVLLCILSSNLLSPQSIKKTS